MAGAVGGAHLAVWGWNPGFPGLPSPLGADVQVSPGYFAACDLTDDPGHGVLLMGIQKGPLTGGQGRISHGPRHP